MDEQISRADLTSAVESLRAVLAAIDAGESPADLDHAAYLRGAADTLEMLAEPLNGSSTDSPPSSRDRPGTKEAGHAPREETSETFPQDSQSRKYVRKLLSHG